MDDVIVTGNDRQGRPATLEVQAKRTVAFTASDPVFADVVALACQVAAKPDFSATRHEIAVAIARTSTKIEQHIQDVLRWAREYQRTEDFFRRLGQPGGAHQTMRTFVDTFRFLMSEADALHDDSAVRLLLSRFQVLVFDMEQPGSICALLARERCAVQLAPADAGRAGELWDSLQQIALEVDAAGGDIDAPTLRDRLVSERGYRFAGDRRLHVARQRIAEIADNTLAGISSCVRGVEIDRADRVAAALVALERGRYLEIRGAGGVGKSGVLKDLAQRIGAESRVVVIAPHRVPSGGWAALQAQLGCEVDARELLADLAGDGGGTLFIDGVDRFDDPGQRATVADLIRAAAEVPGFNVVVTARLDFDADARMWLPAHALQKLREAQPLVVDELRDEEVSWLCSADPALAALLRAGHPAEKLVRNLYRLDRLARGVTTDHSGLFSEAQMARQWWTTGDTANAAGRLERRRVLRSLAVHSLASSAPMDTCDLSADAVAALTESGSLRALSAIHFEPAHDVLRDWAIGCLLFDEPVHFGAMTLENPASVRLLRGVELAARLHAEFGSDEKPWRTLLECVSIPEAHGSWRRVALLALARSERSEEVLNRCLPALAEGNAHSLADLVRAAITVDSQSAAAIWSELGADTSKFSDDFVVPRGSTWPNIIAWSLSIGDRLPNSAVPQFVDLYSRWCSVLAGMDKWSPLLVARMYRWLVEVEAKNHPRESEFAAWKTATEAPGLSMTVAQESDLRTAFLLWCRLRPADTESYLRGLVAHPNRHVVFRQLLPFIGTASHAAPQALADLFLQALPESDDEDEDPAVRMQDVFSAWDLDYSPPSPARTPFLDLLQVNKEQGLRLVRGIIAHAARRRSFGREPGDNRIEIPLSTGKRSFPWCQSYTWSRSQGSNIVASALLALEAWAHLQIERGEDVHAVVDDILGPEGSPAANVLVAVDVMLSHWPKTRECIWPFAASARLLAIDRERYAYDVVNGSMTYPIWVHPEPAGAMKLDDLLRRPSRSTPLDAVLSHFGLSGPANVREAMQKALQRDVATFGAPDEESRGMADPKFAAMSALNWLDSANYVPRDITEDGQPTFEYVPPAEERRLLDKFREKTHQSNAEVAVRGQLMRALTESRCSVQLLEQGVKWAKQHMFESQTDADRNEHEFTEITRFIVAALVMRDGSPEVKTAHGEWARAQLAEAATQNTDGSGFAKQLPYNAFAIASVGYLAVYRDDPQVGDLQSLLGLAAKRQTGMMSVLRTEASAGRQSSPRLTRSMIRLGLASAIYAVRRRDDDDFGDIDEYVARQQALEDDRREVERAKLERAVGAELDWLSGEGPEPGWPDLPDSNPPKARRGISLGKVRSQRKQSNAASRVFALDASTAAQWLSLATELWRTGRPDWLRALVRHCWPWTAGANGVGCGSDEEPGELASGWNDAYFEAAVVAAVATGDAAIKEDVLDPLALLPEERFLDAVEAVLHALDQLWLTGELASDDAAVSIHEVLAQRLVATRSWSYLTGKRSTGIEIHLGGAVAAVFLAQHALGKGPRCYVPPAEARRVDPLLPTLAQLAEQAAGSTFVAIALLGLLEIEPHGDRLPFLARTAAAWWGAQGANTEFWIDHGIGRRLCAWIDKTVLGADASPALLDSPELHLLTDILVKCGTPLARALEERLAVRRAAATK
ncbi:hypothetical protein PQR37_37605 [Paraburkholderia nemoris]|uniref:hypothetical protein n=1 Tax=Paraburkholderia nemoris TaxID=2793076 RepID=UPI0038BAA305